MNYIGYLEFNDWEGETFGYYFEDNEKNRAGINKMLTFLEEQYKKNNSKSPYRKDFKRSYTKEELDLISSRSSNGYMPRCNIVSGEVDWDAIIAKMAKEGDDDTLYKGKAWDGKREGCPMNDDYDEEEEEEY